MRVEFHNLTREFGELVNYRPSNRGKKRRSKANSREIKLSKCRSDQNLSSFPHFEIAKSSEPQDFTRILVPKDTQVSQSMAEGPIAKRRRVI